MDDKERTRVLTIRNVPAEVELAITQQARAIGLSKSEFVQELLSATFGDVIGNFIRTSELVALMDREMARVSDVPLSPTWVDGGMALYQSREFCRLLGIFNVDDLQRIMMASTPWLALRARQLNVDMPVLPHGVSLGYALFIEAAGRDYQTLLPIRRSVYFMTDEARFWREVDEVREARMLASLDRALG